MPDLHEWITQQVAQVESLALAAPPAPWRYDPDEEQILAADDIQVAEVFALSNRQLRATGDHIARHDPTAVLRRCAADRKILKEHAPAGGSYEPYACQGCGSDSEWGALVEHTNDCPTLQALGEGYGLTDELLAQLDRPEPPREPVKPFSEALDDAFNQLLDSTPATDAPATFRPAPAAVKKSPRIPITQALLDDQHINLWDWPGRPTS